MNEHDDSSVETSKTHDTAPAEQPPVGTTAPATGDDRVDAALTRLDELDALDVTEHARVFDDIHGALQDTLAEDED